MKKAMLAVSVLALVAGCGSDGNTTTCGQGTVLVNGECVPDGGNDTNNGSWSLTGAINGFSLQTEAKSAVSERIDLTSLYTSVSVSDLVNHCTTIQGEGSCPSGEMRWLAFKILGTATGSYNVVSTNSPTGNEVEVTFEHIDQTCTFAEPILRGQSGTVTFSQIDLTPGGQVVLDFNVTTAKGEISGSVTAPYCGA